MLENGGSRAVEMFFDSLMKKAFGTSRTTDVFSLTLRRLGAFYAIDTVFMEHSWLCFLLLRTDCKFRFLLKILTGSWAALKTRLPR